MFLLLTLNIFHTFSSVSIVDFEQANVSWICKILPFYFVGNHSLLNFTGNGSTIHFVEKGNIRQYNIDYVSNVCKPNSKPQITKLWYQDGSWKDDLDSFKVYSRIYRRGDQVFQINFSSLLVNKSLVRPMKLRTRSMDLQ